MLDHRQLGLGGARGERIDTQRVLLVAEVLADLHEYFDWPLGRLAEVLDVPEHNGLPRIDRAREMLRVWDYYPRAFIELAYGKPPAWHLLVEPTAWGEDADAVVGYLEGAISQSGAWPTVGALRVRFGRSSNHRPNADKTPGQGALL